MAKIRPVAEIASEAALNAKVHGTTVSFSKPTAGKGFYGVLEILNDNKIHTPSGMAFLLESENSVKMTDLVRGKLACQIKPGYYQITPLGKEFVKSFKKASKKTMA